MFPFSVPLIVIKAKISQTVAKGIKVARHFNDSLLNFFVLSIWSTFLLYKKFNFCKFPFHIQGLPVLTLFHIFNTINV